MNSSIRNLRIKRWLIILSLGVCCLRSGLAQGAATTNYANFQSALSAQLHKPFTSPESLTQTGSNRGLWIGLASVVVALVAFRIIVPRLGASTNTGKNPWLSRTRAESSETILAEQQSFSDFADRFHAGSRQEPPTDIAVVSESKEALPPAGAEKEPDAPKQNQPQSIPEKPRPELTLEQFFQTAPENVLALRKLFAEINQSSTPAVRQQALSNLSTRLGSLKSDLERLKLIPAWQMATALAGLLNQLSEKPAQMTASNLRTAAGGLLVLESLCLPGVDPELAMRPPARFLAVDDEPISRRVVCLALKKVFQEPDLAENGEAALKLASSESYDAIFLDVEMPGMDGYEVCSKLRETEPNRNTPVVFVTSHSDFASREKSASCGGRDLIAKPFLAFEITVKALALVLRGRLDRAKSNSSNGVTEGSQFSATATNTHATSSLPKPTVNGAPHSGTNRVAKVTTPQARSAAETIDSAGGDVRQRFRSMDSLLEGLSQSQPGAKQQKIFEEMYAGFNAFLGDADRGGLKAAYHLASAGGNVTRKLLEKPQLCTPSAIHALETALPLLEELCTGTKGPDIGKPPIRVLVVDDEPLARRAVATALQLTFGKPDQAESGEAAIELAESKPYDVIFLDVIMPGIDGFAACAKIRESSANSATPVVFVTSQNDAESREKASESGGNGFISKPVLPAEISLTALTFAIRARMAAVNNPNPVQELAEAVH